MILALLVVLQNHFYVMNNQEFMDQIKMIALNAFKQIIDQGVAFTIMLGGIVAVGWLFLNSKTECQTNVDKLTTEVRELRSEVKMCDEQRSALQVKVATLETRIDLFTARKKR